MRITDYELSGLILRIEQEKKIQVIDRVIELGALRDLLDLKLENASLHAQVTALKEAIAPKLISDEFFAHSRSLSSFEDSLCDCSIDFTGLGWDDYDCSLEIYGVPNDIRLNETAQRFLYDAGFGIVYMNHQDGWETYYRWWNQEKRQREFSIIEGHRYKATVTRAVIDGNRRLRIEIDCLRALNAQLEEAVSRQNTCVVCSACLLPQEQLPHCEDCIVTDDHMEDGDPKREMQ